MENSSSDKNGKKGFGTFKGVYLPSVLTILGVIMYLRLGWVVGNVGLYGALLIVTMSTSITFLTGLSISATATNMKVKGGGAYFMISRSFGIEAGAAVGVPLFLAQSIGASFYIAGFAESVHNVLPHYPVIAIGVISLVILTALAYISADIALKTQFVIFLLLAASLISFFMGQAPAGGFSIPADKPLSLPSFWVVFAVFFPAVTGIEAGISMSGELKNPARALPFGTLAAILTGYVVYMAIPIFLSANVPQEVLVSNTMIMKDMALSGELIMLGIWGATLSSAIGSLLGAPRTLQALARDHVVPRFLGAGAGEEDTPRIATAITFAIALAAVLLGDINALAPVLTMFFLTSYGSLNLIAGLEGMIGNPSWRPTFRAPWPVSFLGAAFCFSTMLMIDAGATFIAAFIIAAIFYLMAKRNINARWDDIRRSILLTLARYSIYKLADTATDPRTWRPNILVLSGAPTQRFYLIELADALTHGKSFLTVVSILSDMDMEEERIENLEKSIKEYLRKRRIPALVRVTLAENVIEGARDIIDNYGLGTLAPNTILLGETEDRKNFEEFSDFIRHIYRSRRNLVIVREGISPERTDNSPRTICVWWGGQHENAGLMLVLAYMLQMSPEWKNSKLQLKTIVTSEGGCEAAFEHLRKYLVDSRLDVEVDVLLKKPEDAYENIIDRTSKGSDFVILGIKPPEEEESVKDYASYYAKLLKSSKDYPPTAFVLSAEMVHFGDIFN